jgi:hypothetical protein
MRVFPHIGKLDDCVGQILVRVICNCGGCREIGRGARALGKASRLIDT